MVTQDPSRELFIVRIASGISFTQETQRLGQMVLVGRVAEFDDDGFDAAIEGEWRPKGRSEIGRYQNQYNNLRPNGVTPVKSFENVENAELSIELLV